MTTLVDLLTLDRIERDIFRGHSPQNESFRIFGGQVIAQALMAAYGTVEDRLCHSLHAYFIHPGDTKVPIIFQVDRARDGGSFTTRRVIAVQHGRQIFNLAASFQVAEAGFEHQFPAPLNVPEPETLEDDERMGDSGVMTRAVTPPRPGTVIDEHPPFQQSWMRATGLPDDPKIHQAALAYSSDHGLLSTSVQPHPVTWDMPGAQNASLDHAVWFHRPFDFNEWHLHDMDSPSAAGTRGFGRGSVYDRKGRLVASTAQEGMVRIRPPKPTQT